MIPAEANLRLDLIEATLRLTDKVPELRVVLGHSNNLTELRKRNVYAKLSGFIKRGQEHSDPALYKPMLDFMLDIFGEDRVVYARGGFRERPILRLGARSRRRTASGPKL